MKYMVLVMNKINRKVNMEKVLVVKEVPGMLKKGDVLQSINNGDFTLSEKENGVERFVSIDYVTVSDNVPEYFDFILELVESKETPSRVFFDECRTPLEIQERLEFFQKQLNKAIPGSESEIVYSNLIWFIEWLRKEKELLK